MNPNRMILKLVLPEQQSTMLSPSPDSNKNSFLIELFEIKLLFLFLALVFCLYIKKKKNVSKILIYFELNLEQIR